MFSSTLSSWSFSKSSCSGSVFPGRKYTEDPLLASRILRVAVCDIGMCAAMVASC